MSSQNLHGDDWPEVLGGLVVGLVTFTWGILTLGFLFIKWLASLSRGRN